MVNEKLIGLVEFESFKLISKKGRPLFGGLWTDPVPVLVAAEVYVQQYGWDFAFLQKRYDI